MIRTFADSLGTAANPCEFAECRHHIAEGASFTCALAFVGGRDGPEATLEEVGDVLGVSRETVRKIEASAMRKLRRLPVMVAL